MNKEDKIKKRDAYWDNSGRVPPHNKEAEEIIIGCVAIFPDAIDKVAWLKSDEFYIEKNQNIWKAILDLYNDNRSIDYITIGEQVRKYNQNILVSEIAQMTSRVGYEKNIKEHANIIRNKYHQRELIKMGFEVINHAYDMSKSFEEIIQLANEKVDSMSGADMKNIANMKEAILETAFDIRKKASGEISSQIYTGWTKTDININFQANEIVVIAAGKSIGKSQLVIALIRAFYKNNEDLATFWLSMEEPKDKLIKMFIAEDVGLTFNQMSSVGYKLNEDEIDRIGDSLEAISEYNIEFIDKKQNINEIINKSKNFCKRHEGKIPIIVIDNLGLITANFRGTNNEIDDYIANKLIELRDLTGALIIVVHHLTKEAISKNAAITGYRPMESMVRGSSRIIDYANMCLLCNYPYKYNDLREEQEKKYFIDKRLNEVTSFNRNVMKEFIWSINENGDKDTDKLKISNLFEATYNVLFFMFKNEDITFKDFVTKYKNYFISANLVYQATEGKWKDFKRPNSVYTFAKNKMYNNSYNERNDKEDYMYGKCPIDKRGEILPNLWILESTKNRNASAKNEKIIRFNADLDYNKFIELEY